MSDLMDLTWNNPMRVTWVNLMGKSLWFENECPYRFDLIDLNEKALCSVEWMSLWEWLGTTLWEWSYGRLRVSLSKCEPYEKVPIKMNGIDEKWMNRGRISEIKWNEWFEGFDLEQPYEKVPMVDRRCPYQNDLNEPYENVPIKMIRFDWIEVNRTIWGDMSELKEVS